MTKNTVQKVRESLEVREPAPGCDQGGTVIGKDGKAKPAKKGPNGQGSCQGNRVTSFLLVQQLSLEEFEKMDELSKSS